MDLADLAGRDHPARRSDQGIADVGEPDRGRNPGGFSGPAHSSGLIRRQRQWFFAKDMLAGLDGGERHIHVQMIGCTDMDNVYSVAVADLPPIIAGIVKPPGGRKLPRSRELGIHKATQPGMRDVVEHRAHRP